MKYNISKIIILLILIFSIFSLLKYVEDFKINKYISDDQSYLVLKSDKTFKYHINVCEGYLTLKGKYQDKDNLITLTNFNTKKHEGYSINKASNIYFTKKDNKTLEFTGYDSIYASSCVNENKLFILETTKNID
ncbi:MAG: hypothetical protein RSB41_00380 [Bacilli bacterium]